MDRTKQYTKPLGRSIVIGCIMFTTILCLALSIMNFFSQRSALYERYQSHITDILQYVDHHIDDDDLKQCIESQTESETYKETLRFMDQIMNDFSIHYLYSVKPLNLNPTGNVMSVLSAEDDYNRYVDTQGNLYLGWISEDEYDTETVKKLFEVMEGDEITFFTERTGWSVDYTGAMPLKGADGKGYAILCVDIDITALEKELWVQVLKNTAVTIILGVLYLILFLRWTKKNVTEPIVLLEKGVVNYAAQSRGQRNVSALKFNAPEIHTDNEVESLADAVKQMTKNMQEYVSDILSAERTSRDMRNLADEMSELAAVDALTKAGNKLAYTKAEEALEHEISDGTASSFGIAVVDLNYLKVINDTYGHPRGDLALKKITDMMREGFPNCPVFRTGGDEFAVLFTGESYNQANDLISRFISNVTSPTGEKPWERISAAVGYAEYDPSVHSHVRDVLKQADQNMYQMKKEMKAERH